MTFGTPPALSTAPMINSTDMGPRGNLLNTVPTRVTRRELQHIYGVAARTVFHWIALKIITPLERRPHLLFNVATVRHQLAQYRRNNPAGGRRLPPCHNCPYHPTTPECKTQRKPRSPARPAKPAARAKRPKR